MIGKPPLGSVKEMCSIKRYKDEKNERVTWRPGAVFFNSGCNEKVFSPKPWRKFRADPWCHFRENALQFRKNDVTEPKTSYSNNQL